MGRRLESISPVGSRWCLLIKENRGQENFLEELKFQTVDILEETYHWRSLRGVMKWVV